MSKTFEFIVDDNQDIRLLPSEQLALIRWAFYEDLIKAYVAEENGWMRMASMYELDPCCTCQYRRTDGKIRTSCLACKHAYFPMTEAYETKADLYVKETDNAPD